MDFSKEELIEENDRYIQFTQIECIHYYIRK